MGQHGKSGERRKTNSNCMVHAHHHEQEEDYQQQANTGNCCVVNYCDPIL